MISQGSRLIPRQMHYFSRLILAALFAAITMLQLLSFPGQFRYEASNGQGSQGARWFLTIMVGLWLLMAQISIVALWHVLGGIYRNDIRSPRGIKWINVLVKTLATAAAYGVAVTALALLVTEDPAPVVVTATLTTFILAIFLVGYFVRHQILRPSPLI